MAKNSRNATLDILKLIASYFVVFIHVRFYGTAGDIVAALARFAVPVFFMTSGYFCYGSDLTTIRKRIIKITKILLFASILYNALNIFSEFVSDGYAGVTEYFSIFLNIKSIFELVVFNSPFSATRLWFLFALIYVYVMQWIFVRFKVGDKVIFTASLVFLVLCLILGEGLKLFDIELPEHYVRNFLLTGFPFFGFGLFYKKYSERVRDISAVIYWAVFFFGVILTLLEFRVVGDITLHHGAVLMTLSLFGLSLYNGDKSYPAWLVKLSECSLGIYIFHKPVTIVMNVVLKFLGFVEGEMLFTNLLTLTVCVVTTMVSLVFYKVISIRKKTT